MKPTHTSHEYEAELRELRGNLLAMSARCERGLQQAISMLLDRDASQAEQVFALDERIDRDEIEIDELALRILALRQPVAYDLRFLATTLKFVTDLERIGDKAVSIAKRARELATAKEVPQLSRVSELSTLARSMLREALDAFVDGSAERAEHVLAEEIRMNELFRSMHAEVVTWMGQHATEVAAGLSVIAVLRSLERVADHATNLAEQVVFMVRGDDVRHRTRPREAAPDGDA